MRFLERIKYNDKKLTGGLNKVLQWAAVSCSIIFFPLNNLTGQIINNYGTNLFVTEGIVVGSRDVFNVTGGNPLGGKLFNFGTITLTGNYTNYAHTLGNGIYMLDGNWTNTGIFEQGTSTVLFKGPEDQLITSTGGANFYNMGISNTGASSLFSVTLNNNVTVTDTLYMSDGNIDPQGFLFFLSSRKAEALSYTSVTGSRVFNRFQRGVGEEGTYLFPIGIDHYNPITLTTNEDPDEGTVLSQFFNIDPGSDGLPIPDPPVEIWEAYPDGFWRLTAGDFFSSNNFDVSINAEGFVDSVFPSTRLIKRTSANTWIVDGQHVDADTINQKVINREELTGDLSPSGTEFAVGRLRALILEQPTDTTVCETTPATFSVVATGIQTLRYSWYRLVAGSGDRLSNIGPKYSGVRTNTLTINDAQLSDIGDYFCIISDRNNNRVSTDTVHLHVNKIPIATASFYEQNHECSDIPFEDIILGLDWWDNGTTFVWSRNNPGGITTSIPETGTENNIGDVLAGSFFNNTDAPVTVTFTIIPVGPTPTYCAGEPIYSTITVNPVPRLIVSDTISSICYGDQIALLLTTPTQMTQGTVMFDYTIDFTGNSGDIVGNNDPGNDITNDTFLNFVYQNNADTINSVFFHITPKNDVSGCNTGVIVEPEVKVHPEPLRDVYIKEPFTCMGGTNGVLTAVLAKSSKPNTLNWTGPWGIDETYQTSDTESDFTILYAGLYNLTVSDSMNCTNSINNTTVFGTTFETLFSVSTKPGGYGTSCYDTDDGMITLGEVANADGPFAYWLVLNDADTVRHDTLQSIGVFKTETGLAAGDYTLVMKDNNGCFNDYFPRVRITEPPIIEVTSYGKSDYSGNNISCAGYNDGSVWIEEIVGGNYRPEDCYSYEWFTYDGLITGPDTLDHLENIPAGKYYLRITDWIGCETLDSVIMTEPEGMRLDNYTISLSADGNYNVSCEGGSDGFIELDVSGGTGEYFFDWSNGEGFSADSEDIYNLSAGTYSVTVTDLNGCLLLLPPSFTVPEFSLSEPTPLSITANLSLSLDGGFNINCYDGTGSIDISVSGGSTGNYSYEWTTTDGSGIIEGEEDQDQLTAGTYNLVVYDINGCTIDTSFTLTEPSPIGSTLNPTHITCYPPGFDNGSIDLVITGGIEPYSNFIWSDGSTLEDPSGLSAGQYSVTFIDANGCVKTDSVTILLPPDLIISRTISDYNGFNVTCNGSSDGWIKVDIESGKQPYIFNWSKEDSDFSAETDSISNLTAGRYILHVVDANMCETIDVIDVIEPGNLGMTIGTSSSFSGTHNINCFGDSTASIDITPVNNVGSVSYQWSDGNLSQSRNNLPAGQYELIMTDENYCAVQSTIEITEPEPLNLSFNLVQPWCPDMANGSVIVDVTGGVEDYEYHWSDNSTGNIIENSDEGFFDIIVVDANGCIVLGHTKLEAINESCLIIPNTISPNGDLINDYWNIDNRGLYPDMVVKILNRWGITIWESEIGYPNPWNGRNGRGRELPVDSYHYIIEFGDNRKPQVGSITIVK